MKHLQKYESFSYNSYNSINEEFILNFLQKAKSKITSWQDRKKKKVAERFLETMDELKDDAKFKKALDDLKNAASKLSNDDKNKILNVSKGVIPAIPETDSSLSLKKELNDNEVNESYALNESYNEFAKHLLNYLGLSVACVSFIGLLIVLLKIVIAHSALTVGAFGLSLGTLGAILMGCVVAGGLIWGSSDLINKGEDKDNM